MAWPLIVLAVLTAGLGFLGSPLKVYLGGPAMTVGAHEGGLPAWMHHAPLVMAVFGMGLAWLEFGRPGARRVGFVERIPALYNLFSERWYMDHFYRLFVDRVIDKGISYLCFQNDNRVIDGGIDGISNGTVNSGRVVAFLHTGMIQHRLIVTFAVIVFLSLYFFF